MQGHDVPICFDMASSEVRTSTTFSPLTNFLKTLCEVNFCAKPHTQLKRAAGEGV